MAWAYATRRDGCSAARYANPLTSLPGNIPISQHIAALIESGEPFATCYCDLNNFKPFNDVYGYWRGDDMIRLCADIIRRNSDPQRDFVGHVGGDDFVMLAISSSALSGLLSSATKPMSGVV